MAPPKTYSPASVAAITAAPAAVAVAVSPGVAVAAAAVAVTGGGPAPLAGLLLRASDTIVHCPLAILSTGTIVYCVRHYCLLALPLSPGLSCARRDRRACKQLQTWISTLRSEP